MGFTLCQEVEGELLLVLYGGRPLKKAEKNYCMTNKELLGCCFTVKKCEFHLLGNEYVTYTDHEPLIHLQMFCDLTKNRFGQNEYLQSMNVKIFS